MSDSEEEDFSSEEETSEEEDEGSDDEGYIPISQLGLGPPPEPSRGPAVSSSFTPLNYRSPVRSPTLQIVPSTPIFQIVPEQPRPDVQGTFSRVSVPQIPRFEVSTSVPPIQVLGKYLVRNEGEEEERFKVRRSLTLALISSPWSLTPDAALKAGYLVTQQTFLGTVYDKEVQQAIEYLRFRLG